MGVSPKVQGMRYSAGVTLAYGLKVNALRAVNRDGVAGL